MVEETFKIVQRSDGLFVTRLVGRERNSLS